jgi:hypothetical protein
MSRYSYILVLIIAVSLVFPILVSADHSGLHIVPECPQGGCGWSELVQLAANLMNYLISIAISLSAVAFAWAGFIYITAAGSEEKIKKAHGIFWNVAIGLILALAAWLIVWLFSTLLSSSYSIFPETS